MKNPQKKILIVGDQPLVEEYRSLCISESLVVTDEGEPNIALELTNLSSEQKRKNLSHLDETLPQGVPILSSSVTITVAEQASWIKNKSRLIGLCAFPTLVQGTLLEFARSIHTDDSTCDRAKEFAASIGKETAFVADSVGLVMPRILSLLVNEACFALMEGVAEANDIDTAMKLGTNYPAGPMEWGERIGPAHIHAVVAALYRHFGEELYRVAPCLQSAAIHGTFGYCK